MSTSAGLESSLLLDVDLNAAVLCQCTTGHHGDDVEAVWSVSVVLIPCGCVVPETDLLLCDECLAENYAALRRWWLRGYFALVAAVGTKCPTCSVAVRRPVVDVAARAL